MRLGAVSVVALLPLTACGGESDNDEGAGVGSEGSLRVGHGGSPGDVISEALDIFAEQVDEGTDGRWTINHYGASQLGDERELIEAVSMGSVDMTIVTNSPIGNFVPEALFYDLPGLYSDIDHVEAVNESYVVNEYLADALLDQGLVFLATTHGGFRNMTNNRGPIENVEDLSGLTVRVQESPMIDATYSAVGGVNTVPIPISELYTALDSGVANAQENPTILVRDFDLAEVQDYMSITEHSFFPRHLLINEGVWETMSEEDQQVFLDAADEAAAFKNQYYRDESEQARQDLESLGMQINEPGESFHEEFYQLMEDEVYPEFVDDIGGGDAEIGQQIIDDIRDMAD